MALDIPVSVRRILMMLRFVLMVWVVVMVELMFFERVVIMCTMILWMRVGIVGW